MDAWSPSLEMKATPRTDTCATCYHWHMTGDQEGECHRRAPQAVVFKVADQLKFDSRFPLSKKHDWCGDYEPS